MMRDYLLPERGRAALLTIDVQCDFALPNSPAKVCGTMAAVPAMRRLLDSFRERTQPIVHAVRLYRCDGSNVELCHRAAIEEGQRIVMPGSSGAELVEALKRDKAQRLEPDVLLAGQFQRLGPNEHVMYKPRSSAFYQTTLEDHLRALGVTTLLVCGCDFPARAAGDDLCREQPRFPHRAGDRRGVRHQRGRAVRAQPARRLSDDCRAVARLVGARQQPARRVMLARRRR